MVIRARDAALQNGEVAFNRVRVAVAANILVNAVVHGLMAGKFFAQVFVLTCAIRHQRRLAADLIDQDRAQRIGTISKPRRRNSGTSRLRIAEINQRRSFFTGTPSSLQTLHQFAIPLYGFIWLRLADDGTNYTMSYSFDGVHYLTITTGTKSAGWLGITGYSNIFVGCDCYSELGHFTVLSYQ
jgi:hypothetical protein